MDRVMQVSNPSDLIPISQLELDLPAPTTGWGIELDRRGVEILTDDIGRPAVTRAAARELITERRETEARAREAAEQLDASGRRCGWRVCLVGSGRIRSRPG